MKKLIIKIILSSALATCISTSVSASTMSIDAIKNYVNYAVEQLFAIGREDTCLAQRDISIIKDRAITKLSHLTFWEKMLDRQIVRSTEEVEETIYNTALDYIEEESFNITMTMTHNDYIAGQIARSLKDEAANQISRHNYIAPGALASFVGERLRHRVADFYTSSYSPSQYYQSGGYAG